MAGSYILPQVKVFQDFAETPNDVTQNLNPFLIGPNYQLMRYSDAGERGDCTTGSYVGTAALELKWSEKGYDGSIVDKTFYGVTLEDVYAKLGDNAAGGETPMEVACIDEEGGSGSKFEFTLPTDKSFLGDDPAKLVFGIALKAGDYISYVVDGGEVFSKIMAISCGKIEEGHISKTVKFRKTGADASDKLTVSVDSYVGEKPVSVKLVVSTVDSAKKVTWTSNVAGISSSTQKDLTTSDLNLGKGLKVKLASASADPEDGVYLIDVTLTEPIAKDTVTIADSIPSATSTFKFYRHLDVVEVDEAYLTVADAGVTVVAGAKVTLGTKECDIASGTAYLTQRNLRMDNADGIYSLREKDDIVTNLGAITPENPLAYAAQIMMLNCKAASIKYLKLTADASGELDWAKALAKASLTTEVYAFCPLTEERSIIDDVVAHCEKLSQPEEKSWRISFFSCPTERVRDVTPQDGGAYEKCKVSGKVLTCYKADGSAISTASKFLETVTAGDDVTITTGAATTVKAKVVSVESNQKLTLDTEVTGAETACAFSIVHTMGVAEYVTAIANTSKDFANRRAYNVFPNGNIRDTNGNVVSGMYAAAAVCGLACSVAPQQPITNVEIKGFADLPDVYSTYSREQLNEIAAGGTLILMQDTINGPVYVRHQISTDYSSGNLNATELSLVKNLDSISFYFANRFKPYIGRYNVTDDLLAELKAVLHDGLSHLETATEGNRLVGPQVLAEGTEIRSIYRDPDQKDHVYANVGLDLPAPFNNFDLHLQVI